MINLEPDVSQAPASPSDLTVRIAALEDLDAGTVMSWKMLERRAMEPNAFLSPHFVIPALRHLGGDRKPVVLLVERPTRFTPQVVGMGVFELPKRTKQLPFRHWVAAFPQHTFLNGLLIDPEFPRAVINSLLDFLTAPRHHAYGVEFRNRAADTPQSRLLEEIAGEHSLKWIGRDYARATIRVSDSRTVPVRWPKSLRENRNKLRRLGKTAYSLLRVGAVHEARTQTFLALENTGWKAEFKHSLASRQSHCDFFREMAAGFAGDEQLLYSELAVDDKVIASTCNLISGRVGFGFKLGWNTDFARFSPGMLQHLELLEKIGSQCGDVDLFDSCTVANSPLERVWPDRRQITSGVFTYPGLGALAATSMRCLRQFRTSTRRLLQRQK